MRQRRVSSLPRRIVALFLAGLALQLFWHGLRPGPEAEARTLPSPPSSAVLRVASLGDPVVLAKLLMLWLQSFDNQPGVSIPFRALDYERVEAWLERILALDPRAQYPLLAASRVYGAVPVEAKQRQMLEFVYRQFMVDPDRRWRWLVHAAIVAKHRLRDPALALEYARAITEHATAPEVPFWARDLTVLILQDMGELQAARVLVGGLLESGIVQDPSELRFLKHKLTELQARSDGNSTGRRFGDGRASGDTRARGRFREGGS